MANPSILAAFERMWQHINIMFATKEHAHDAITNEEIDALCANTLPEQSLTEAQVTTLYNNII